MADLPRRRPCAASAGELLQDVCGALPGHAATFCPAAEGVLWDGETVFLRDGGLATFVDQSLPVMPLGAGLRFFKS